MKSADIFFNRVFKIIETILVFIFGLLVVDVLLQVFSRYILNTSFTFTEELARFSLIWLSILGAAYLNGKREHLSMDFLYQKFPAKYQKKVLFFIEICILSFALIVMVIGGFNLVYTTLHLGQLSGTLRIPLGYIYAVLPISGLLIMCFSIYHICKISANKVID
jgi:TRAP-type C4-dicarboxylate transport system permease small subunit